MEIVSTDMSWKSIEKRIWWPSDHVRGSLRRLSWFQRQCVCLVPFQDDETHGSAVLTEKIAFRPRAMQQYVERRDDV